MRYSALCLTVLLACLTTCSAKPADIVARVPSDFYYGTKWVLFRDDSIPDPPPNVIQHENNVQVLPSYKYPQQSWTNQRLQQHVFHGYESVHVTPTPVEISSTPTHDQEAPVLGDFDSEVIENHYLQSTSTPLIKVSSYGVTSVPQTSIHIQGPDYYLRKKKNA